VDAYLQAYDRNIALADYITRQVHQVITSKGYHVSQSTGNLAGAKGGDFRIDNPGQQVLQVCSNCLVAVND
jgi:hypothetical protein